MNSSTTAEETKDPAIDLIKVELFQSYPWKYLFIKPYIEAVVSDFNVTAPRYELFDRMLREILLSGESFRKGSHSPRLNNTFLNSFPTPNSQTLSQNTMEEENPLKFSVLTIPPLHLNSDCPNMVGSIPLNNALPNSQPFSYPTAGRKLKLVTISWRGSILSPTYSQLRQSQGNLDLLEKVIGSREANASEKSFKLRFVWKGFIIWPSPQELRSAKGGLNELLTICPNKTPIPSPKQPFRGPGPCEFPEEISFGEL